MLLYINVEILFFLNICYEYIYISFKALHRNFKDVPVRLFGGKLLHFTFPVKCNIFIQKKLYFTFKYNFIEIYNKFSPLSPKYPSFVLFCVVLKQAFLTVKPFTVDNGFQKCLFRGGSLFWLQWHQTTTLPFETCPQMHSGWWVFPLVWTFYRKFAHKRWIPFPQAAYILSYIREFAPLLLLIRSYK